MKLTNELISQILRKKVYDCSKEEIAAILKLVGCEVKEFTARGAAATDDKGEHKAVSFEVHHRYFFLIEVEADNGNRIVSYNNEWFMEHGIAMPTDNLAIALHMVLNYLLPKLPVDYEGPRYLEHREWEYKSLEEMQGLLSFLQEDMGTAMEEANKADEERKAQREQKRASVLIGTNKIGELLPNMVGELDARKMDIYIEAINKVRTAMGEDAITGVSSEDGKTLWGNDSGEVLEWVEFLDQSINVGNIALK